MYNEVEAIYTTCLAPLSSYLNTSVIFSDMPKTVYSGTSEVATSKI